MRVYQIVINSLLVLPYLPEMLKMRFTITIVQSDSALESPFRAGTLQIPALPTVNNYFYTVVKEEKMMNVLL